ncbi:MAG: Ni/Fe-hydrogenase cytochrome b subunit [Rhodocyclaceae bacterium]|nr:Ni/Fe-hydrogenase cytochrome b subunit [Rhodocyclaceae bacterium]
MSHHYEALDRRPVLTPFFLLMVAIAAIGTIFLVTRFVAGMGAVSNLNGGYPWGVWVIYDIVVGTALACGGYALAVTVYVFNKGRYHPLIRPALLTSLLGYGFAGFGAFVDMGRYWNGYNIFLPWHMNTHAVMLEVGLCVAAYILVLFIEFSPTLLEWLRKQTGWQLRAEAWRKLLDKSLFFFIALGILLPTMHQSSLGSFLIAMGYKVHPLWQTLHLQPLLAVLSAFTMGFAIVIFEGSLVTTGFKRHPETHLFTGLGRIMMGLIAAFLVFRFGYLILMGKVGAMFAFDLGSVMFWIETALFAYPLYVLASPVKRENGKHLLYAAVSMILAGSLYRFDGALITYNPGPGYSYFPALPELIMTVATIATEIALYLFIVKTFPVLPREDHATA